MNFIDLLQQYNIPVAPENHQHSRSGWIELDCPLCNAPGHFRLGYNVAGRYCSCWQCGKVKLDKVIRHITGGMPWPKIFELIKQLPTHRNEVEQVRGKLVTPRGVCPLKPIHRDYLRSRGLDPNEMVRLWDIKGIGLASSLSWRIFIPIQHQDRQISWTTRGLTDDGVRYISASPHEEEISHKSVLFGADYARHSIVICEGPFDVFAIGPGAVAVCGTAYSRKQLLAMSHYLHRCVCFDNEPAAQARANKLCDELEAFPGETYRIRLDAKDAGAASKHEITQIQRRFLSL